MNWKDERWVNEAELDTVNWREYDVVGLSARDGGTIELIYQGPIKDASRGGGVVPRRPLFVKVADFGESGARERVRKALDPEGTDVGWVTD